MDISDGNSFHSSQNPNTNTIIKEGGKEPRKTIDLRLRSQERAKQIKKAREEFLCIPGTTTTKKMTVTSSVGDLPFENDSSEIKRKLENTTKKSAPNNEDVNVISKKTSRIMRTKIFENYENPFTQKNSYIVKEHSKFLNDHSALNKSYSCPSSPKL